MKHILFVLLLLSLATLGFGQNVGIGTATPDASAKVDIQSTNSGILIPRMTTVQRTAIGTPATGLLVFDNTTSSFWYYDGSVWIELISDSSLELVDADGDTKVQVEESPDEDIIHFDLAGTEHFVMDGPRLEVMNSGQSVFVGEDAGDNDDLTSNANVLIGYSAGLNNTTGQRNIFIGNKAGYQNTDRSFLVAIGDSALFRNSQGASFPTQAINNTAVGSKAGASNTVGGYNTFIGHEAGLHNTSGSRNTFAGRAAGWNTTTGGYNSFVGQGAGLDNTTGSYNTGLGWYAGSDNVTGTYNIFLGFDANPTQGNLTNAIAIGYNSTVSTSNSMVLGNNVNVGIGSSAPQEKLHVEGGVRIGNTGNNAAGNIRWTGSDYEGYDGVAWRSFTADQSILEDADGDTKIQVEESPDEDIIRFDLAGTEHFVMNGPRLEVLNNGESVFIGEGAGASDDLSANQNVFVGASSGASNTTGNANNFLGFESGTSTTTGSANTFLGFFSGQTNSTGHDNTFIGASAGRFNTIGHSNAFIGNGAGYNNVDGNFNTYIGRDVGLANATGNNNTFVGYRAGYSATVGNNNFFGYQAGLNTTTGVSNTFLGNVSGRANTTGHDNAFVGSASGYNNTTGHSNVFIGPGAGYQNQTGNFNVYLGRDAGLNGTTGTGNVFIGYQAGMNEAGNDKLYIDNSNTTSPLIYGDFNSNIAAINGNLGVGDITPAATLTVGNGDKFQVDGANGDVLFTDDQASITFPAATASAAPMIQMFASGTTNPTRMVLAHSSTWSNYGLQYQDAGDQFHFLSGGVPVMTVDLGPSRSIGIRQPSPTFDLHLGNNSAAKPTSNTWTVPSDARLKKDVHNFEDGLAEILKIRPVTYTYTGEAGLPQETGVGIIAQELKEIAPYMVSTWNYEGEGADRQEYYAVDNGAMTYMLINAIQEQHQLIEQLQQQVEDLSSDR